MVDLTNNSLWVEKYRPNTLDGYVGNEKLIAKIETFIQAGDIPHLLFHAHAGGGKTTLAKILTNVIDCSAYMINASDENNVDTIRTKIKGIASGVSVKGLKVIILDEADYLSTAAQAILRNVMEKYSRTCRFILTCNYLDKIIDPLQSRCQIHKITPPTKNQVYKRCVTILKAEKVKYTKAALMEAVIHGFPDVRRVINLLQDWSVNGKLVVDKSVVFDMAIAEQMLNILQQTTPVATRFTEIRQVVADARVKHFDGMYDYLFEHLDVFGTRASMYLMDLIGTSMYQAALVANQEINFMALVSRMLMMIDKTR